MDAVSGLMGERQCLKPFLFFSFLGRTWGSWAQKQKREESSVLVTHLIKRSPHFLLCQKSNIRCVLCGVNSEIIDILHRRLSDPCVWDFANDGAGEV